MPIVLAGLVISCVAVLGMLLIHAQQQFTRSIAGLMPSWHIPGLGSIRDWVTAAGGAFGNTIAGVFGYSLAPLAQLIAVPVRWLQKHLTGWLNAAIAALTVLTYLRVSLIPWVLNHLSTALANLRAYVLAQLTQARMALTALISYVQTHVIAIVSAVETRLLALIAAAEAQAAALASYVQLHVLAIVSAVETRLLALVALARAEARDLANYVQAHLLAYVTAAIDQVRAELSFTKAWLIAYCDAKVAQVVNAAIANEHVLFGRALATAWPRALDEIDAVIVAADTDFAAALANLRGLRGISLANPFAVVGALAGVLTGLLRFTRDCTIPNCRNLSQVGRDLQSLFGVVEDGALLAFIAEAARDPEGTATTVRDVLGGVLGGALHEAEALIGAA